eukprot:5273733-Amphidinium_carterae.1
MGPNSRQNSSKLPCLDPGNVKSTLAHSPVKNMQHQYLDTLSLINFQDTRQRCGSATLTRLQIRVHALELRNTAIQ